ncbi:hypothetical protein GQ53DRAFT_742945 [Thozetella sp. PMI_491]|nr:hypothetical protein GQ53DRAFT_742945 [Thozetella sp. PMI_491]
MRSRSAGAGARAANRESSVSFLGKWSSARQLGRRNWGRAPTPSSVVGFAGLVETARTSATRKDTEKKPGESIMVSFVSLPWHLLHVGYLFLTALSVSQQSASGPGSPERV